MSGQLGGLGDWCDGFDPIASVALLQKSLSRPLNRKWWLAVRPSCAVESLGLLDMDPALYWPRSSREVPEWSEGRIKIVQSDFKRLAQVEGEMSDEQKAKAIHDALIHFFLPTAVNVQHDAQFCVYLVKVGNDFLWLSSMTMELFHLDGTIAAEPMENARPPEWAELPRNESLFQTPRTLQGL